jgi:hypothetical protein
MPERYGEMDDLCACGFFRGSGCLNAVPAVKAGFQRVPAEGVFEIFPDKRRNA